MDDAENIHPEDLELILGDGSVLTAILERITSTNMGPSLGLDSFSGIQIYTPRKVVTLQGFVFDSLFLAEFIFTKKDKRDPICGNIFTKDDMILLGDSLNNESLKESLIQLEEENSPKSVVTHTRQFCNELIDAISAELLLSCELSQITSMNELQILYDEKYWILLRCLGALIKIDLLSASSAALKINKLFSDAILLVDSPDNYIYEPSALLPIGTSIKSLCNSITSSILYKNEDACIKHLNTLRPLRIVY
jgi:hypothetical protein